MTSQDDRIPTRDKLDLYTQNHHSYLVVRFNTFALKSRYPLRCWKTFAALLWCAHGKQQVIVGLERLMHVSRQCRRSVQRALFTLDRDGWITRQNRYVPGGYWWSKRSYTITR
jgi:hypothetical protein